MPTYSGDRIRQARIIRSLSSKELAEALAWSPPRLTKAERATSVELTSAEAEALATHLRFNQTFFSAEPDPPLSERDLLFRAPKRMTKREKQYLVEFARLTQRFITELDERHGLPPVRLPQPDSDLTALASSARAALQMGPSEPIRHLTHSMERAGVVVVVRPRGLSPDDDDRVDESGGNRLSEVHHGYSTWVGSFRDRPFVVARASDSWERTRWTMAHELGHLLLHRVSVPEQAEEEASRFASELLAPIAELSRAVSSTVTLASLIPVKKAWGISLGALLPHLRNGGLISDRRFEALRTQLYTRRNTQTGRTWGLDEPGWNERAPERPRLLSAWCERNLGTSDPQAVASLLPLFPQDVLTQVLREQRRASAAAGSPRPTVERLADVRHLDDRRKGAERRRA